MRTNFPAILIICGILGTILLVVGIAGAYFYHKRKGLKRDENGKKVYLVGEDIF